MSSQGTTGELPIDAAIDDYEALGVRLEHLASVFKLVIQCQSSSDPKVIVGALYAVESLLEVVGTSFCQLGTAMMEARGQAVQASTRGVEEARP